MATIDPVQGLNFFMPIFAFLFVFLIVFALLQKTKVLGDNKAISVFLSLLMAIFFIVNSSLIELVSLNTAWVAVFIIVIFFILLIVSFTHGKIDFIQKTWVGWVLVAGLIIFFIYSASYIFNWAINVDTISNFFGMPFVGFIVLLVVALIASWILAKK